MREYGELSSLIDHCAELEEEAARKGKPENGQDKEQEGDTEDGGDAEN